MAASIGNTTSHAAQETDTTYAHDNDGVVVVLGLTRGTSANTLSTAPKYDGVNMVKSDDTTKNDVMMWQYYDLSPSTGANNITYSFSGATNSASTAVSIVDCDATGPAQAGENSGTGTTASLTLNNTTDGSIIVATVITDVNAVITPGAGLTEITDIQNANNTARHWTGWAAGDGGNVALSVTWVGSEDWVMEAIEFAPLPSGFQGRIITM